MLEVLVVTGPIYAIIALGFLAGRFGLFSKPDTRALGSFVVKFALPALVFTALARRPVREIFSGRYVLAYALGSLAVMLASIAWGWWRQRKSPALSALSGLGMSNSNNGFIGYPIAIQVVGPSAAATGLAMCVLVENLVMIPLMLTIADGKGGGKGSRVLLDMAGRLVGNPIILAIAAGFGVALLGIEVAAPVARTIDLLATAATSPALFVIGGLLVGLQTKGMRRDVSAIALGKLALHPFMVGLLIWLVPPADNALRVAAVVFASMPMLSMYPILAQKYGFESVCAAALLLTTMVSFFTISAALWILGPVLGWAT